MISGSSLPETYSVVITIANVKKCVEARFAEMKFEKWNLEKSKLVAAVFEK
jgi:hypothetical protein